MFFAQCNNTQIDNVKNTDVAILILNLIEYSYNYSKTSGSLWQYYRDETFLDATCGNFSAANNKCPLF